jgi:hypothetical protein
LSYLVRGNDLTFRAERNQWIILLPEPASEARMFLDRAEREVKAINRNRPRGPLPNIEWQFNGSWSDLITTSEEIVSRVNSHIRKGTIHHA